MGIGPQQTYDLYVAIYAGVFGLVLEMISPIRIMIKIWPMPS